MLTMVWRLAKLKQYRSKGRETSPLRKDDHQ